MNLRIFRLCITEVVNKPKWHSEEKIPIKWELLNKSTWAVWCISLRINLYIYINMNFISVCLGLTSYVHIPFHACLSLTLYAPNSFFRFSGHNL